MPVNTIRLPALLLAVAAIHATALADEKLAGIACRSVHLAYEAPDAVAFYNEVTVEESARGTYFCAAGFGGGYYGLQELGDGRKLLIFSVWDPGDQNDPDAVAQAQRVRLEYRDPAVRIGRFGNEGTGGQSFLDYDWKPGTTYRFLVTARLEGDRTHYTSHFYLPEAGAWKRLVTFSTLNERRLIQGGYAFIEDFQRDRVSTTHARRAAFGPGWVRGADGTWTPLDKTRFTADSNPAMNIDAGTSGTRYFLATGGATRNEHAPLRSRIPAPDPAGSPPADLEPLLDSPAPPSEPTR